MKKFNSKVISKNTVQTIYGGGSDRISVQNSTGSPLTVGIIRGQFGQGNNFPSV